MKKKLIAGLLTTVLALGTLAGCGSETATEETATEETAVEETSETEADRKSVV